MAVRGILRMGNPRPGHKANAVDCRHPFQIAFIRARDRRTRLASSLALQLLRPNSRRRRRQHQGWEASINAATAERR